LYDILSLASMRRCSSLIRHGILYDIHHSDMGQCISNGLSGVCTLCVLLLLLASKHENSAAALDAFPRYYYYSLIMLYSVFHSPPIIAQD